MPPNWIEYAESLTILWLLCFFNLFSRVSYLTDRASVLHFIC